MKVTFEIAHPSFWSMFMGYWVLKVLFFTVPVNNRLFLYLELVILFYSHKYQTALLVQFPHGTLYLNLLLGSPNCKVITKLKLQK